MFSRFSGLWRHPDFMKLWLGETISLFGSQISLLALPLTAILVLQATPAQLGFLSAAEFTPMLLISLFAGVWVDRLPRRPLMIGADLGLALLLSSIPLCWAYGLLTIEYLYILSFLTGTLSVLFGVAYQSYLPSLIENDQLVEANSKLEASQSLADIGGPAIGGALIQLLSSPLAILADAISFLVSALCLKMIRQPELELPKTLTQKTSIWRQIGDGLTTITRNRILLAFALCNGTINFSQQVMFTVFPLYIIRELGVEPALFGLILGAGSIGALLGVLSTGKVTHRFGLGPAMVGATIIQAVSTLLIPLAFGPLFLAIPMLIMGRFFYGLANPVYAISQISVRQSLIPTEKQGRVNASMRFVSGGVVPLGALSGGLLGGMIGLRATLLVGALLMGLCFIWIFFSPVPQLRERPKLDQ